MASKELMDAVERELAALKAQMGPLEALLERGPRPTTNGRKKQGRKVRVWTKAQRLAASKAQKARWKEKRKSSKGSQKEKASDTGKASEA